MAEDPQIVLIARAVNAFVEKKIKILTLNAVANLVEDTPRDTGWARSNYIPSIGKDTDETSGSREEAEAGNVSNAAQQRGVADVAIGYTLKRGSVFITNNVPYLIFLNNGSSKQAPSNFIEASIIRAIRQSFVDTTLSI